MVIPLRALGSGSYQSSAIATRMDERVETSVRDDRPEHRVTLGIASPGVVGLPDDSRFGSSEA